TDRLITCPEALCDRDQVGRNALLLAGVERARAAHSAHDLVENQENAVAVADLPNLPEIAGRRGCAALGGAPDSLGNEGDDSFRAQLSDGGLVLRGQSLPVGLQRLALTELAISVRWRDVVALEEHRSE